MEKIRYNCKNCGWETSIREEWGDLKPKRCMNKKCNTNFAIHKDALIITRPEPRQLAPVVIADEKPHGKNSRRSQKSS